MKKYPYTGKRFGAFLIDYILIWSLTILYILYFGEVQPDGMHEVQGMEVLPIFALWLIYVVVCERLGGTLGHRLFKLKVVTMDGGQPDTWHTFLRRVCDPLDGFFCGLVGYLLIKNTQYNQRVGDLIAKTQVIGQEDTLHSFEFDFDKMS